MRTLNLRFAAGLIVGLALVVAGAFFLHHYQSDRIARDMRWQVDRCRESGETDEAIRNAYRYLEFRPDDVEMLVELSTWLESRPGGRKQVTGVINLVERALRVTPDRDDLRRRVVVLNLRLSRWGECLDHLDRLLQNQPNDPELLAWLGECKQWTGRHAEAAASYKKSLLADPKRVATYLDYSYLLHRHLRQTDEARRMLEAAVAQCPDRADARIALARFLRMLNKMPEAQAAANEAVRLAPDDVTVLMTAGEIFQADGKFRQARELMQRASDREPNNGRVTCSLAWLMLVEGKSDEALTRLRSALAENPNDVNILTLMGDMLALDGRLTAVEAVVADLDKLQKAHPEQSRHADYMKGRLAMRRGDYAGAADQLDRLRLASAKSPNFVKQVNYLLANCYRELRREPQELEAYRRIVESDENAAFFRLEFARALAHYGEIDESLNQYRAAVQRQDLPPRSVVDALGEIVDRCRKVHADKSLGAFERTFEAVKADDPSINAVLAKVELWRLRSRLPEALKIADQYLARHPNHVPMHGERVRILDAMFGPDRAASALAEAERRLGDQAEFRIARLRLAGPRTSPGHCGPLLAAGAKLDGFTPDDRVQVLSELITTCAAVGDSMALGQALEMLRHSRPDHMAARSVLLSRAITANDHALRTALRDELAAIEGANGWCGRLSAVEADVASAQSGDARAAAAARSALEAMAKERPGDPVVEFQLGRLAEIADAPGAREHYSAALDRGLLDQPIEEQLARLVLADVDRRKVRVLIEDSPLFDRLRIEADRAFIRILLPMAAASNRSSLADRLLRANPDATGPQLVWLGRILQEIGSSRPAQAAFDRATKVAPASEETWAARLGYYAEQGDQAKVNDLIAEARKTLSAGDTALAISRWLESSGRLGETVKLLREAATQNPSDTSIRKRLAGLYIQTGQVAEARAELSAIIDQPKVHADDLAWARRTLAVNLAVAPSTEAFRKALALIDKNQAGESRAPEDMRALAVVLAAQRGRQFDERGGLTCRQKALTTLELLDKDDGMTADDLVLSARLLRSEQREDAWRQAAERLEREHGNNVTALTYLVREAIRSDRLPDAERLLARLQALDPNRFETIALTYIAKNLAGDEAGATTLAETYVDGAAGSVKAARSLRVGLLVTEFLQNYALADKPQAAAAARTLGIRMTRQGLGRDPQALLNLVRLYCRDGRTDLALDFLQTDAVRRSFSIEATAAAAALVLRNGDPTPQQTQAVVRMVEDFARRNPSSVSLMLARADLLDSQRKHEKAAEIYRHVLQTDPNNLLALNNLAWILSFDPKMIGEAQRLIQEAIDRNGPLDALLETRGRILFAAGKRDEGMRDLAEAVASSPSAGGYFSLALMYSQAERPDQARVALDQARRFGLSPADVHPLDAGAYRELVRK